MFVVNRLKAQMVLCGLTGKELAEKIGIAEPTFYRKINADGNFNRKEIAAIMEILHIDDPRDIFFSN